MVRVVVVGRVQALGLPVVLLVVVLSFELVLELESSLVVAQVLDLSMRLGYLVWSRSALVVEWVVFLSLGYGWCRNLTWFFCNGLGTSRKWTS